MKKCDLFWQFFEKNSIKIASTLVQLFSTLNPPVDEYIHKTFPSSYLNANFTKLQFLFHFKIVVDGTFFSVVLRSSIDSINSFLVPSWVLQVVLGRRR